MILRIPLIILAKFLRLLVRIRGGHGSALPGYVIEKLDPHFLRPALAQLPQGVIVVTGTNGKTTTSHMITTLFKSQGLRVLTNASGSNLTRGLISTVIEQISITGKLPFDIAVLEIDEAYSPRFTSIVPPRLLVALNVMRDQLDRYGEIDTTASLIASAAQNADTVLVNGNDELLARKISEVNENIKYFGLTTQLSSRIATESNLYGGNIHPLPDNEYFAKIVDIKTTDVHQEVDSVVNGEQIKFTLSLLGEHNAMNAIVAISTTFLLLKDVAVQPILEALSHFKPAFGRGETLKINNTEVTIALIKNPSGFTQNIKTFVGQHIQTVLIVINDEYADGRDVSWLWDAQIANLKDYQGRILVGGVRRFDMAICLKYQGIQCEVVDTDNIRTMMDQVMREKHLEEQHILIVPTYTAMLSVRKWFAAHSGVKRIW